MFRRVGLETTLLTVGLVCVVAAIVGGGLRAFNIELPGIASVGRQALLGSFGILLIVLALVGVSRFGNPERLPTEDPTTTTKPTPVAERSAVLVQEHFSSRELGADTWERGGDRDGRIFADGEVLRFDVREPTTDGGSRQVRKRPLDATEITVKERMDACEPRDQGGAGLAAFFGPTRNTRSVLTVSVNCGSGGVSVQARLSPENNRGQAIEHNERRIQTGEWIDIRVRIAGPNVTVEVGEDKDFLVVEPQQGTLITQFEVGWFVSDKAVAFLVSLDDLVVKGAA